LYHNYLHQRKVLHKEKHECAPCYPWSEVNASSSKIV
jgi:hypothetical protein